jgi:hypothetical protein
MNTKPLRVALMIPEKDRWPAKTLCRRIKAGEVDLVVFPEGHFDADTRSEIVPSVRRRAEELGAPVLAGVYLRNPEMQCAAYWNPAPATKDTREHFYAKHSTSANLAYELEDYGEVRDALFSPILLKGRKLGVMLCHDMFFGLVAARLVVSGADTLFDLTGSNVNLSKWANVASARSIEHRVSFLCTMANDPEQRANVATAFGFREGYRIQPSAEFAEKGRGRGVLIDIAGEAKERPQEQAYTEKRYEKIRVALGAVRDCHVHLSEDGAINGAQPAHGTWVKLRSGRLNIGVMTLALSDIRDPLCIHRLEDVKPAYDVHLVVFVGNDREMQFDDALALAKLRAIEHRMAIGLFTPTRRELLKTNRYKNIQRFRENDGVFGLDGEFSGGTYSHAKAEKKGGLLGIPLEFVPQYRALMFEGVRRKAVKPGSRGGAQADDSGFLQTIARNVASWLGRR